MSPYILATILLLSLAPFSNGEIHKCRQLKQLFSMCRCYGYDSANFAFEPVVDCSSRGLIAVPTPSQAVPDTIYELLLNNNNIISLPHNAFHNIRARVIDLRGNSISTVNETAFEGLTDYLHTLHLQGDGSNHPPKHAFLNINKLNILTLVKYNVAFLNHLRKDGEPYGVFVAFTDLQQLTLQEWKLEHIEPGAFFGPTSLKELALVNQAFGVIPKDALRSIELSRLEKLTISGSLHIEMHTLAFSLLMSLKHLDLSNNSINNLPQDVFHGLNNTLETLVLANNALTLDMPGLKDLFNLKHLDLSNNPINSMPKLKTLNTGQLITLKLRSCEIKRLDDSDLYAMSSKLYSLDLSENKLSSLGQQVFQGATQLKTLLLANQRILVTRLNVPSSLSVASNALENLDLSGQRVIATSLWPVISQLINLQVLDLSSTLLNTVPPLTFQRLTKLRELYLNDNSLTEVNQLTLVGPRLSLRAVYLADNQLTTLSYCLLYQYELKEPLQMTLNSNRMKCNCSLQWLKYSKKLTFLPDTEPRCADGSYLRNESSNQFFCSPSYTEPVCAEHYQTATTIIRTPVIVQMDHIGKTTITVSWTIEDNSDLNHYTVRVIDKKENQVFIKDNIQPRVETEKINGLKPGKPYTVCVTPVFPDSRKPNCRLISTLPENSTGNPQHQTGGTEDVGIIIGAVVGALVLLVLLGAIVYLILLRSKPKTPPTTAGRNIQPRTFTKQEPPAMAGDKESMQVVAISDGMSHPDRKDGHPSARVGRAHFLTSDGMSNKVMADIKSRPYSSDSLPYENDHGHLPKTPDRQHEVARHGYYNDAFHGDKYDEIEVNL